MRKWILLVGILALGLVWASKDGNGGLQCNPCYGKEDKVTQKIHLKVPVVVRLVLDNGPLDKWTIKLNKEGEMENCFAIPNDITSMEDLEAFLEAAGDELAPADSYPFIAYDDDGSVKTWGEVASGFSEDSPYLDESHVEAPAKGNVICKKSFVVEKYTNCPDGAVFSVALSGNEDSGFGAIIVYDTVTGPDSYSDSASAVFTEANGDAAELVSIEPGSFYDDEIVQWLWLMDAEPGVYKLKAVYTLAAVIPE